MKKPIILTLLLFTFLNFISAQMVVGTDTLYGNEWIDYSQTYFKIPIAEDGVYRINGSTLIGMGIPLNSIQANQFQIFHLGNEIGIYTSSSGNLGGNDYIEFYGEKNRSQIDRFLFDDPDNELLNPDYSLVNDTSAYFLTWKNSGSSNAQYNNISNDLANAPSKEEYFFHELKVNYNARHTKRKDSNGAAESKFKAGEGFADAFRSTINTNFSPAFRLNSTGENIKVTIRLFSKIGAHDLEIKQNATVIHNESFNGEQLKNIEVEFDNELPNNTIIRVNGTNPDNNNDKYAISMVKLEYPRSFDFGNNNSFRFKIPASVTKKYLEIENFDSGGSNPILYDYKNNIRIQTIIENDLVKVVLPPSSEDRTLILINNSEGFNLISTINPIQFFDYSQSLGDYMILTNTVLMDDGSGNNRIQEYIDYRASSIGGSHNPFIINIQQLYNQFGYGIDRHGISVRNFSHYIKRTWDTPVRFGLIIGKGIEYKDIRKESTTPLLSRFMVPSFGSPGADNLMFAAQGKSAPMFPIGRIAAWEPDDIKTYLDKVKLHESNSSLPQTIEDRLWMKRVLHLGGGGSGEQVAIRNYLENMENTLEDSKFGAEVIGFYKNSIEPIQISESEDIFETINDGVSMITFFGHSAPGTFDFNIDNPENWTNQGKYPLMNSLGCYSGNIHTTVKGISENFCFYENKGALAFGASTGVGYVPSLHTWANYFYSMVGEEMYGAPIGQIAQATIRNFESTSSTGIRIINEQYTIHGDPAVRLNPQEGTDYVVDPESIIFEPNNISSDLDSFDVTFDIINLGFASADSTTFLIEQQLPNQEKFDILRLKIPAIKFRNKVSVTLPSFGKLAAGLNRLFITVDVDNEVDEYPQPAAETNNELKSFNGEKGISFYIYDDSAIPIYPDDFGIINSTNLTFYASTSDALSPVKKYIFEIDTTENFNSPDLIRNNITQIGGLLKWTPSVNYEEDRVYYWRVSPDSINIESGYKWENRSFLFKQDASHGWNQSHHFQYNKDELLGINVNSSNNFDFENTDVNVTVSNKIYDPVDRPFFSWDFGSAASSVNPWNYFNEGVSIFVGDSITGFGWLNSPGGDYNSVNSNSNTRVFSFPTNTMEERMNLMNFLNNVIQPNNYVVLFTVMRNEGSDFSPESWAADQDSIGMDLYSLLENQGANLIRNLEVQGSSPYTFIYKKDVGALSEGISTTPDSRIVVDAFLERNSESGEIVSTKIGPASNWVSLNWELSDLEPSQIDTSYLQIFASDNNGNESLMLDSITDFNVDLSFLDANLYPFVKLVYHSKDEVLRTAADLDYWRIYYEGIPEMALNPNSNFTFLNDTLQQGEDLAFSLAINNVSNYDADSLLIKATIIDDSNNEMIETKRLSPINKNGQLVYESTFETKNLDGAHSMIFEANPNEDQPELYHFNNFLIKRFFVDKDKRNPVLDVTFDGIHILDGDIISSEPEIFISVKDENPYFNLADTSLFRMYLNYPDQSTRRLYFGSDQDLVIFTPPSQPKEKAIIELRPKFLESGTYELIVEAEDATGNESGELGYKVSFEIITEKQISNVLNYPNPFSTATSFVYTLTGDRAPDYFKIQIMTVSGRVVKEITQQELGDLRVGTHKTDYQWDGTDTYGDRLANGVYLYKVVTRNEDGEEYKNFNSGTNDFFTEGFGKMVIMR